MCRVLLLTAWMGKFCEKNRLVKFNSECCSLEIYVHTLDSDSDSPKMNLFDLIFENRRFSWI